jgi:hypothetical protein
METVTLFEQSQWPEGNDQLCLGAKHMYMITYETETGEQFLVQRAHYSRNRNKKYFRNSYVNEQQCKNAVAKLNAQWNTDRFGYCCIDQFETL